MIQSHLLSIDQQTRNLRNKFSNLFNKRLLIQSLLIFPRQLYIMQIFLIKRRQTVVFHQRHNHRNHSQRYILLVHQHLQQQLNILLTNYILQHHLPITYQIVLLYYLNHHIPNILYHYLLSIITTVVRYSSFK